MKDLDWKEGTLYKDFVVPKVHYKQPFENNSKLFREDELKYIRKMLSEKNLKGLKSEDI